jgi:subtilisin-like proprotein convertase family protein
LAAAGSIAGFFFLAGCGDDDDDGPVCGNGICEEGETNENCPEDCEPVCGNGVQETGEECDGEDLANTACTDLGFEGGDLACAQDCTFDTSGCTGAFCGNGVIEGDEQCDATDLGGQTCQDLGFDDGELGCSAECTFDTAGCCDDTCPAVDETQCASDIVQTCVEGASGCLEWEDTEDCTANQEVCIVENGAAMCAPACTDECDTIDELRCNGDLIEICAEGADGCNDWVTDTDCSTTNQTCAVIDTTPQCVDPGLMGDSCDMPLTITGLPYTVDGTDMTADFTDSADFGDATDCGYAAGVDAIFEIDLDVGDAIRIYENGGVDSRIRVLDICDPLASTCLVDEDLGTDESVGVFFSPDAAGTYYIIVEAYFSSPSTVDYAIVIEAAEGTCDDGVDDDGDGLTDCEDPDCFGQPGCTTEAICDDFLDNDDDGDTDCADTDCFGQTGCTAESICDDGADNDNDGSTDCADSDCANAPGCVAPIGAWQEFELGVTAMDLPGCSLTFTYDATDYDWAYACTGLVDFPVDPTTGTVSTQTLTLTDSDDVAYTIQGGWLFTFFGRDYGVFYVGSNGFITFGEGDSFSDSTASSFFAYPRIAPYDEDLDPSDGSGVVYVDEFSNYVAITYEAVTYWDGTDPNWFQAVLYEDGTIEFHYVEINQHSDVIVGLSNGGQQGSAPAPIDFIPPAPPTINEIAYDQDGADASEFVEIAWAGGSDMTGLTLVHINGSNGAEIWTLDLTGEVVPTDGFYVFGAPSVPNVDLDWDTAETGAAFTGTKTLQNGPDSILLVSDYGTAAEQIVDAVEYESGAAVSFAETAPAPGIEFGSWQTSIGRYPDGLDTDDNSVDVVQAWWPTPGFENTPAQPPAPYLRITGSTQSNEAGTFPIAIPDNDPTGITSVIDTTALGWFTLTSVTDIQVGVRIFHTWEGDLTVTLTAPDSTTVTLHDESGGSSDDITTVYDMVTLPDLDTMNDFDGVDPRGTWTLSVSDNTTAIDGVLVEWVLWIQ